jgi:hypothetical protein
MNREEIIRLAREAASEDGTTRPDKNIVLYAAKTSKFLERFAQLVRAYEREACAKVVEGYCGAWDDEGHALAAAIRART